MSDPHQLQNTFFYSFSLVSTSYVNKWSAIHPTPPCCAAFHWVSPEHRVFVMLPTLPSLSFCPDTTPGGTRLQEHPPLCPHHLQEGDGKYLTSSRFCPALRRVTLNLQNTWWWASTKKTFTVLATKCCCNVCPTSYCHTISSHTGSVALFRQWAARASLLCSVGILCTEKKGSKYLAVPWCHFSSCVLLEQPEII